MKNRFFSAHVTDTDFGLMFDEHFDPKDFSISFHSTATDNRFGAFQFEPRKNAVSTFIYYDEEDLSPVYTAYELKANFAGYTVIAEFEEHNIGAMYRAALTYIEQYLERV